MNMKIALLIINGESQRTVSVNLFTFYMYMDFIIEFLYQNIEIYLLRVIEYRNWYSISISFEQRQSYK